jgi:hypothetical protein
MYSAQSPDFLNGMNTPSAITANFTAVSNPLGISINNAFGRLWPADAPFGLQRIGTSTIVDPNGVPLANAPNQHTGGVYAGDFTGRQPSQVIPGALNYGGVGTALLGLSPDGSARAVFAVVVADGSIVQEHTAHALDGLAPAGTVEPLLGHSWNDQRDDDHDRDGHDKSVSPRLGVLLNYSPTRILFVSEPFRNSIAAIELTDDGRVFRMRNVQRFHSEAFDEPIDLAPAQMETSDPNWASNTTLDVNSDFYVANRGNNTIVRMTQSGQVVAVRELRLAGGKLLGEAHLNGIASSPDGKKLWVTVTGRLPGMGKTEGAVIELPAFEEQ